MKLARPSSLYDTSTHYCGGCGHGIVHRLLAEVMTELDLPAHTIAVAPVGCAVFAYDYLKAQEASGHTAHYLTLFEKHRAEYLNAVRKEKQKEPAPATK